MLEQHKTTKPWKNAVAIFSKEELSYFKNWM